MITRDDPTELRLFGIGVQPYSARGLTQTLEPIEQLTEPVRAISGGLIDMSYEPFQKYRSTITGNDQQPPAFDRVWKGRVVTVHCIAKISKDAYAGFGRDPVPGSVDTQGGFEVYRPILDMMVFNFQISTDEYGHQTGWTLELEEM